MILGVLLSALDCLMIQNRVPTTLMCDSHPADRIIGPPTVTPPSPQFPGLFPEWQSHNPMDLLQSSEGENLISFPGHGFANMHNVQSVHSLLTLQVTCVYLFHELPAEVRRAAAKEMVRVLKPGGILCLTDSVQYGDRTSFDKTLGLFSNFNEPYYLTYIREDLGASTL